MMSNTTQPQPQQSQQQTTTSIIKQNYRQQQQQYDATNGGISDTDMSERGTIRSYRSTNTTRMRSQQPQQQLTNGSVMSFDQSSIATTTTTTTLTNNNNQRSNNHHRSQHRSNQQRSNRHTSSQQQQQQQQRGVNFNGNADNLNTVSNLGQQHKTDDLLNVNDDTNNTTSNDPIQVQILPQDDNWGENTTAYTAATSEVSGDFNDDNLTEDGRSRKFNPDDHSPHSTDRLSLTKFCSRYFGFMFTITILLVTYLTPILFIILPRLNIQFLNSNWQIQECGIECEGLLIGISFKLFLVLLGVWALYLRKPKATLPRIYELRALILFLLCILTFSYWLFYGVRIIDARQPDYYKILQFTVTYVDVLLFIYIISVFIMEIRQLQPHYVVRIMRSPDGIQREYTIGKMSIQRAAVWLLEEYYKDFPVFNPWLENAHKRRINIDAALKSINETGSKSNGNGLKYYNIDSGNGTGVEKPAKSKQLLSITSRGHNDRFYEEYEYERRLRKRRARLLTATEDAFTHIKRINVASLNGQQTTTVMDPFEAAQAIFTSIARDLRRYLRITRQQPYFTRDNIVSHLADCISYDMSPKSFLQRYFNDESIVFNQRALLNNGALPLPQQTNGSVNQRVKFKTPEQSWILICDTVLYQNVEDNLMLVLKQNEISLMCTFKRLPYFNLIEDILDTKRNKFVLKMNSETSV